MRACFCRPWRNIALPRPRLFSTESISHSSNKTQIYKLTSPNPFLNLSIEHYLLQNTPAESTVLILYTNSPCVVLGRNQNPWLEANLSRLAQIRDDPKSINWKDDAVKLVRRRSGGGTVFHDSGNVNFSVICPPEAFDRDKHAEMVVRALKRLGRHNTRVNERHDIVMDHVSTSSVRGTFKISGSAYKLTRLRSLHHGTCLLRSPNLPQISEMLRSPAAPFITAKGVDSVRTSVKNVELGNAEFEDAVAHEFRQMYGAPDAVEDVGEEALKLPKLKAGYEELQTRDWIYGQTPGFTFAVKEPSVNADFSTDIWWEARHGRIQTFRLGETEVASLHGAQVHDVGDWSSLLAQSGAGDLDQDLVGSQMNFLLGTRFTKRS